MAYFFGVDTNSVSTLFGSMNTTAGVGTMNFLSDYASIRNGSYGKLLRAHYRGQEAAGDQVEENTSKEDTTSRNQAILMRDAAAELKSSVKNLTDSKSDLFTEKEITQEDGSKTTGYDVESIYKAVNDFAKHYNDVIGAAGDSENRTVLSRAAGMTSLTDTMRNMLGKIGIQVSSENKLQIDAESFKKADMSTVKSLFHGTGGYAYQVGNAASTMLHSSNTQIAQGSGSLYTRDGGYGAGFYSGSLYSNYF